jgi:hypothetical protein
MSEVNVEPTAEVIDTMAKNLVRAAKHMEGFAADMRAKKDLTYAAEAINAVSNLISQLRLDLLVTRPIRELDK